MAEAATAPLFVPDQAISGSVGESDDGLEPDHPDFEAYNDLEAALRNLRNGNVKAAVMYAADATNRIAKEHSINGGGWY